MLTTMEVQGQYLDSFGDIGLRSRSVFNCIAVQQLVAACRCSEFTVTDGLRRLVKNRAMSLLGTQMIEDVNGSMKNAELVEGAGCCKRHYRKATSCWYTALRRGVVDRVHRFKPTTQAKPVERKVAQADADA